MMFSFGKKSRNDRRKQHKRFRRDSNLKMFETLPYFLPFATKTLRLNFECDCDFFLINMNMSSRVTHSAAECSHSHSAFFSLLRRLRWLRAEMRRHPSLFGAHPAFHMHECAREWVCMHTRLGWVCPTATRTSSHTQMHTHKQKSVKYFMSCCLLHNIF